MVVIGSSSNNHIYKNEKENNLYDIINRHNIDKYGTNKT